MTNFIKAAVSDIAHVKAEIDQMDRNRIKAAETATRVEGFRLSSRLKEEIRAGSPGGMAFAGLSEIAKRRRKGAMKGRTRLYRLAAPVRYSAARAGGVYSVAVGFLSGDIANPAIKSRNRISASWARIAAFQQAGGAISVTDEIRQGLIKMGAAIKKKDPAGAKYFFLRPSTTQMRVPASPIIDPFWRSQEGQAAANIRANFERKMAGERI